jgi:5-histidylcysteine sulfoxide synthase
MTLATRSNPPTPFEGKSIHIARVSTAAATVDTADEATTVFDDESLFGERPTGWFTSGLSIQQTPGHGPDGKLNSLPQVNGRNVTRKQLQDYFDNTWALTEVLFGALQGEQAFHVKPRHNLRHPLIFYFGHPAAVYVNKFRCAGLLDGPVNEYFEHIMETGVDEMSWDDMAPVLSWPSVDEVHQYRQEVYEVVSNIISKHKDGDTITMDSPLWSLILSFEHERIHLETTSVLMREMDLQYLRAPDYWPQYHPSHVKTGSDVTVDPVAGEHYPADNEFVQMAPSSVTIGKPDDFPSFGWDNEYGEKTVRVSGFQASKFMVTNGEFLEFVRDGGYFNTEFWDASGQTWRGRANARRPWFWVNNGPNGFHQYKLRALFSEVDMPWDSPADVNFHEARAYCNWKAKRDNLPGLRVLTEPEHHVISNYAASDRADVSCDPIMVGDGLYGRMSPDNQVRQKQTCMGINECLFGVRLYRYNNTMAFILPQCLARVGDCHFFGPLPIFFLTPPLFTVCITFALFQNEWKANANLSYSSQNAVDAYPPNALGFHDTTGSAWEWCEDHFCALPGFKVHKYYEDFSTPCFDGLHHVIIGGSMISTGNLTSRFSRYHFRPHFFQHSGFRMSLPDDIDSPMQTSCTNAAPPYVGDWRGRVSEAETQALLAQRKLDTNQVLASHFPLALADHVGDCLGPELNWPNRASSQVFGAIEEFSECKNPFKSVLDLGCGVGGVTLEFSRKFERAVGIDINAEYIALANKIKNADSVSFPVPVEGHKTMAMAAKMSEGVNPERVEFMQADVLCIPADMSNFSAVFISNTLGEVVAPSGPLKRMGGVGSMVAKGGLLVIVDSYLWCVRPTMLSLHARQIRTRMISFPLLPSLGNMLSFS